MEQTKPNIFCSSKAPVYFGVLVVGILIGITTSQLNYKFAQKNTGIVNPVEMKIPLTGELGKIPSQASFITGTVISVIGDKITINADSPAITADKTLSVRTILTTAATKILKMTQKDPKIFEAERIAFEKALKEGSTTGGPLAGPEMVKTTPISISDISVGSSILIRGEGEVSSKKEITAIEIRVLEKNTVSNLALPVKK